MAKRVSIVLTDDLDGGDAAETVTFGLDGSSYEIDLSSENAARLRGALQPFVGGARKTGGRVRSARGRSGASGNATAIRAWAQEQGLNVSARGRVRAEVRAAYEAAQ